MALIALAGHGTERRRMQRRRLRATGIQLRAEGLATGWRAAGA